MTERPVTGRWLEDLPEGLVVRHAVTRTITEADNTFFSTLTMNPQPPHLDAQFAAESEFGQRLAGLADAGHGGLPVIAGVAVP
jgi:acyl dehydratase